MTLQMIYMKIRFWLRSRELLDDNLQDSGSTGGRPWNEGGVKESAEKFQFHI